MTPERRAMHAQMSCGMPDMPSIRIEQALQSGSIQFGTAHRGSQMCLKGILRHPAPAIAAPALDKRPSRPTTVQELGQIGGPEHIRLRLDGRVFNGVS